MRIALTGSTGLVGSELVDELRKEHDVFELARYSTKHQLNDHFIWFDLHTGDVVKDMPRVDVIINLAAMASNAIANVNPIECFDINATGVLRLLHAFRNSPDAVIVQASSSEVYAKPEDVRAINPYAASKIAAEQIVRGSGRPYVIMRPFNTYGRALVGTAVSVVDKWIVSALRGYTIHTGDMDTIRDFMFRTDHVNAYLSVVAALSLNPSDVLNREWDFGTGTGTSLNDLLHIIGEYARVAGKSLNLKEGSYHRPNDVPLLLAKSEAATEILGWKSTLSIEEGVAKTWMEWESAIQRMG